MFPKMRMRRIRQNETLRRMLSDSVPGPEKFLWPTFVLPGKGQRQPIDAMPGQSRLSVDELLRDLQPVVEMGIGGVLLFGLVTPEDKTDDGCAAWAKGGSVQEAVRAIRREYPDLLVFTDVCLCAYTSHGHCGLLDSDGEVINDATNELLAKVAVSHAEAGAHGVSPSAMMDGQVAAIRSALDAGGFEKTILMSYSSKFASAMYGPFREAENSAPSCGDRRGYQVPDGNRRQALRESQLDEAEGADILMVKPSLFYLDILSQLRDQTDLPVAAYNVSGEYSMLVAAAERGWGDLRAMVRESTLALTRAGADIIISYWANQYDTFFKEKS